MQLFQMEIHAYSVPLILRWATWSLEPILGDSVHMVGDTLDGVSTHCKAQSHTLTHNNDHLEMPIISLVWGGGGMMRPESLEETPKVEGDHAS